MPGIVGGVKTLLRLAALLACLWTAQAAATERQPIEDAVLARINYARQHPREYAEQLKTYRTWFRGNILYLPGDREGVWLEEGTSAVDEAIAFLQQQAPLPPLSPAQLLALAARDHAAEQGPAGAIGHGSPDGASPGMRVQRRGGGIYVGENISYGFDDADEVVRQFIVDDGVPDRGHRHALFDRDYRYAGVGCGPHAGYRHMCVVDFSQTRDGRADMTARSAGAKVQLASADGGSVAVRWSAPRSDWRPAPDGDGDTGGYEVIEIVEEIEE